MASVVDICNIALSAVRAGSINSIDEVSTQAKICKLHYSILRDQMLQDSPWQFAGAIKPLALLVAEQFDWRYVYQYPADCLRVNRVIPDFTKIDSDDRSSSVYYRDNDELAPQKSFNPVVEYKVFNQLGNRIIAANFPDLRIDYRVRIEDTNLFSSNFTLALAHLLAANIAIPLVGVEKGDGLRKSEYSLYQNYLNAGIVNELNEQDQHIADSDFITIRS